MSFATQTITRSTPVTAVLKETIIVPAHSELETLAVAPNFVNHTGTWLLENQLFRQKKDSNIIIARAIVTPGNHIIVRLINPTNTPATIYKDTKLASLSQLTDDDQLLVSVVGTAQTPPISNNKKKTLWETARKSESLTDIQREQLYQVLLMYADVFPENDCDLGRTGVIKHTINTGNAHPIRQSPRRIPKHLQSETSKLINQMLQNNIIQKSTSPWSSVVLVKKKDGSVRFCIDYRKVNNITRKDAYPLPRIDDTLDTLSGAKWFSTLDLLSGYWQVEVTAEDREKTAFVTRDGLFEFNVMPFGLCNGPATFQRLMDMILTGLQWTNCLIYLDDVIIFSHDFKSHLDNLQYVFQRLRSAGLKLKPTLFRTHCV